MATLHLVTIKVTMDFPFEDYWTLLDFDSKIKIQSYKFRHDQLMAFTSVFLKKYYLANYLGISPADLQLTESKCGRPQLVFNGSRHACLTPTCVDFNLSHSGEYVALAIYQGARPLKIGVDIEKIDPEIKSNELAQVVYSLAEQQLLANSLANSDENFFKLWTKKEALIKARGSGFNDEFYQTTKLNLDDYEETSNYRIASHQLADYYFSCCLFTGE